jgi:hypothetical protein
MPREGCASSTGDTAVHPLPWAQSWAVPSGLAGVRRQLRRQSWRPSAIRARSREKHLSGEAIHGRRNGSVRIPSPIIIVRADGEEVRGSRRWLASVVAGPQRTSLWATRVVARPDSRPRSSSSGQGSGWPPRYLLRRKSRRSRGCSLARREKAFSNPCCHQGVGTACSRIHKPSPRAGLSPRAA